MKIALLGSTGMLGSRVAEAFRARNHEVLAPSHEELDLLFPLSIEKFFKTNGFDVLVNCAAFTRVDACEEPSKFAVAQTLNGTAVGWMAKYCQALGRILVHFSTDYVFDGKKEDPYVETDATGPLNVYGRTKLQGEKLAAGAPSHYLVRTSWVYGPRGDHFVKRMAALFKERTRVEVVRDQVGSPTYTGDIAQFILDLLERKAPFGTYHFANSGKASWFDFAKEIKVRLGNPPCELVPVKSDKVFRPAERPMNSCFDLSKAQSVLGVPIRPWQEALAEYMTKEFPLEAV
ncbi:MAG TPA: dTDP-4-dehydrorhamnose reductase [bacterium]|nr:dTDP-4-dehydrorhamnose reductase [bacterium]